MKKFIISLIILFIFVPINLYSNVNYELHQVYEISHKSGPMGEADWFGPLFDKYDFAGIEYINGLLLLPGSSNGSQIWRVNKEVRLTPDLIIGQAPEAGNVAFNLWDAEADEDGKIFASQTATSENSDTLRIWTYTQPYDKKAEDQLVLSWAPGNDLPAYHLGTKFAVTGSYEDGTMEIYIPNTSEQSGCNQIFKWDLEQSEFSELDAPDDTINAGIDHLGAFTDIWPIGGIDANEVVLAGKNLPAMKVSTSDGSIITQADPENTPIGYGTGVSYAIFENQEILFLNNIENQNVQIIDVTSSNDWSKLTNEDIMFRTNSLGLKDSNNYQTSDNDIEIYNDGTIDLFVVQTDNGYAHYKLERIESIPIKEVKKDYDRNDIPDLLGESVTSRGIVTTPNFREQGSEYFVQNASSGIRIYKSGTTYELNPGDSIKFTGMVAQRCGNTEIVLSAIELLKHNANIPSPLKYFEIVDHYGFPERFESMLVEFDSTQLISDEWPENNTSKNIFITSKSSGVKDTLEVRIDESTNLDGWENRPQREEQFTMVGIFYQADLTKPYNSGYQIKPRSRSDFFNIVSISKISNKIPENYILHENYPNPFNPITKIDFELPERTDVTIQIFDLQGNLIENSIYRNLSAGRHSHTFVAYNLSSGIYFYKMQARDFTEVKKMSLIK